MNTLSRRRTKRTSSTVHPTSDSSNSDSGANDSYRQSPSSVHANSFVTSVIPETSEFIQRVNEANNFIGKIDGELGEMSGDVEEEGDDTMSVKSEDSHFNGGMVS